MDIQKFYKIPENKIGVVYISYDEVNIKSSDEQKRSLISTGKNIFGNYLLFVGASYPYKNLERTIQAYYQIKDIIKHKLVIVGGRKEYINYVKNKFRYLDDLNKYVKFVDYVEKHILYKMYSEATALIYPSLYEGFGIPPLEAMSCGCPVIVSNTSSLPEVCGDSVYYVDPTNVESIKKGIIDICQNKNLKKELIRKGYKQIEKFSWDKSAKTLYNYLLEVIQK